MDSVHYHRRIWVSALAQVGDRSTTIPDRIRGLHSSLVESPVKPPILTACSGREHSGVAQLSVFLEY